MSLELRQHQLRLRLRRGKEKQEKGLYHPWHLWILLINYPPGILRPLSRLRSMAECGEIHVILLSVIFFFSIHQFIQYSVMYVATSPD